MALNEDHDSMEFTLKRSLLAKSKRAIIVRSPNGSTRYCCVECPVKFSDRTEMEQHMSEHNREYRFLCGICGTALKRKEHLDRHTLEHQEVRPHVCPDCGKAFKRKEHLNIHRTIHSGEKNHTCPLCDKSFYRKDHLQKHLQTHNKMFIEQNIFPVSDQELMDIKPDVMEIKQELMDDEAVVGGGGIDSEMMMEIRDAISRAKQTEGDLQPEPDRPHECPICGKRFKRKDHLKLHSVSHLERDKICQDCGKAFRTDEQLQNHMTLHEPYVAIEDDEYIGAEAVEDDQYDMAESLLVPRVAPVEVQYSSAANPSSDRPHVCPVCHRRFKRKQHLKVHANVHVKQRAPTIWCSQCSEGFFNNSQFESHECMGGSDDSGQPAPAPQTANQENYPVEEMVEIMNEPIIEEPEPPNIPVPRRVFVCRFCSKPFKRKDHYRIHLHVHTGVKSFFCAHCGKGFYRKDHLQKHSQVHLKSKQVVYPRKPKKEMPELFPINMLPKKAADQQIRPEITITAPSNTKLRVPLQIKVPYQVVTSTDSGERRAVTVDPARGMQELLS